MTQKISDISRSVSEIDGGNLEMVNVQIRADLYARLKNDAERQGQSINELVKNWVQGLRGEEVIKPLAPAQVEQYDQDGFLLVSGLIPEAIAAKAEAAMWRCIGADPNAPPSSWENAPGGIRLYNNANLVNCFTSQCLAAAAQLTREAPSTFSKLHRRPKTYCAPDFLEAQAAGEDVSRFFRWDCAYAINVFPTSGEWKRPTLSSGAHLDHSIAEHHHKTFPPVFRIGALIYLNDIAPHGGGTVAWPDSRRKLEALAKQNPERYEYRSALTAEIPKLDLGDPIELTPKRGDVLFLHHLCVHSGSMNVSKRPRFALNMKW
jgi:hypothetical protein